MLTNRLHDPSQNRKHPPHAGPEAECAVRTACSRKAELEQTFKNGKCFNSFGWSEEAMSWRTCSKGHRLGSRQRKLNISALPTAKSNSLRSASERKAARNTPLALINLKYLYISRLNGGEGGIRTLGERRRLLKDPGNLQFWNSPIAESPRGTHLPRTFAGELTPRGRKYEVRSDTPSK